MFEEEINMRLKQLPDSIKKEVLDFIEFLLVKQDNESLDIVLNVPKEKEFKFDWEGDLSEYKDVYTSVDLQHKAMEWR